MNHKGPHIRPATLDDVDSIVHVVEAAHHDLLSEEERSRLGYVHSPFTEETVSAWLEDRTASALVCTIGRDETVVGVVFLSQSVPDTDQFHFVRRTIAESPDLIDQGYLVVGPVVVADKWTGKGLGCMLMAGAQQIAQSNQRGFLVTFSEDANTAATRFHTRLQAVILGHFLYEGEGFSVYALAADTPIECGPSA